MASVRVRFLERQRLQAADLVAEQDYRLALAGRHHLGPHDWGVVRGLRVEVAGDRALWIGAGTAIDGHGRELVLAEPVRLELPAAGSGVIVLEYGEDDPAPSTGCRPVPASRVRSRVSVVLAGADVPVDDPSSLTDARAAGTVPAGSWPVAIARYERSDAARTARHRIRYDLTRYVRHRAGVLSGASGRATLQIGYRSSADAYAYLVDTGTAAATRRRRMAIDRDGVLHVWQPLAVTGTEAMGVAMLDADRELVVSARAIAGYGRFVSVRGEVDLAGGTLAAEAVARGGGSPRVQRVEHAFKRRRLADFPLHFGELGTFRFGIHPRNRPDGGGAPSLRSAPRPPGPLPFELDLVRRGGALVLQSPAGGAPAALRLLPAADPPVDPSTRALYTAGSAPGVTPPATSLRVCAGAPDPSDTGTRVCIRSASAGGTRALTVDGGGRVRVGNGGPDVALEVDGSLRLGPMGKSDPLVPELTALAQIAALYSIGRIAPAPLPSIAPAPAGALAPPYAPIAVVRGADFKYHLAVPAPPAGVLVNTCLEVLSDGQSWLSFRTVHPNDPDSTTLRHFEASAPTVYLTVWLLLEVNGQRFVSTTPNKITLTQS